jgi:acyl-coenzyme A thioesterase PaaI-like protein
MGALVTLPPDPRTTYDAHEPTEDAPRARKHELVRAVKRLIELSAHLDVEAVDDLSIVDGLRADIDTVADRIEPLPSLHAKGGLGAAGGDDGALLERSGISGRSNPLAAPVQWDLTDDRAAGSAIYSPAYEGPAGHVHGGFVAAAFDDLMGSAQTLSGLAGYTGTLIVKMLRPTPLGQRIDYEAAVDRVEGRKIFVRGTSSCDGVPLAEADIVFIAPRDGARPR